MDRSRTFLTFMAAPAAVRKPDEPGCASGEAKARGFAPFSFDPAGGGQDTTLERARSHGDVVRLQLRVAVAALQATRCERRTRAAAVGCWLRARVRRASGRASEGCCAKRAPLLPRFRNSVYPAAE